MGFVMVFGSHPIFKSYYFFNNRSVLWGYIMGTKRQLQKKIIILSVNLPASPSLLQNSIYSTSCMILYPIHISSLRLRSILTKQHVFFSLNIEL